MKKRLYFFLILLFIFPLISSLGVSPGKTEIEFKPNLTGTITLTVFNTPQQDREVEIYANLNQLPVEIKDEFDKIILLEKNHLTFSADESTKSIQITFNFPEGFSKGGIHELRVGARPYVDSNNEGVSVRAGNEIRILINVSDEYVDSKYRIIRSLKILSVGTHNVKKGDPTEINITVISESEVPLNNVYAVTQIVQQGTVIGKLETEKITLSPGEEKILTHPLNTESLSGEIILNTEVFYDYDSVKENSFLRILNQSGGGFQIENKDNSFWFFIFIIIILVVLILLVLILLIWKRRRDKEQEKNVA